MLNRTLFAAIFGIFTHHAIAQGFGQLDVNDIRMRVHSHGGIGSSGFGPVYEGFEVPQGGYTSTLYTAGLWFSGTTSDGSLRAATHLYNFGTGRDFFPGPLRSDGSALADPDVSQDFDRVWVVSREEVLGHLAYFNCLNDPDCDVASAYPDGYTVPSSLLDWPAIHGTPGYAPQLAPFFDFDNDGQYDPFAGDAPCILGDQAMFLVYNDMLNAHTLSGGDGLGLEVQLMPFAYSGHSPALDQTVFLRYRLVNRSSNAYENAFVGLFSDFDIGCPDDDHIGSDPARNLMYVYNWSDNDPDCTEANGYGDSPPAFGMLVLKGPPVDADGMDNPADNHLPSWNGTGFNDGVANNERHGLSRAMYWVREGIPAITGPTMLGDFRGYMEARWRSGVPLTYGGSGYSLAPDALPCFFSFPGTGDPVGAGTGGVPQEPWSETEPTPFTPDRAGIMSMGPFTLSPGQHVDLLFAYVYARSNAGAQASVAALQARSDSVIAFAQTLPIWYADDAQSWSGQCADLLPVGVPERTGPGSLTLFPSPTRDAFHFDAPGTLVGALLVVRDITGREVLQQQVIAGMNRVDLQQATPGIYICEVITNGTRSVGRVVKE
jgi:hypothetical protein